MEKILIKAEVKSFDSDYLENDLNTVIAKLQEFKQELESEGWSKLHLIEESGWDSSYLELYGTRLETDYELKQRIKKIEIDKNYSVKLKEQRKLEYEKLKKEFN